MSYDFHPTWYAFECPSPDCPASFMSGGDGVVLDVRLPWARSDDSPSTVSCPVCSELMDYRGSWDADEAGYGSRGSPRANTPTSTPQTRE